MGWMDGWMKKNTWGFNRKEDEDWWKAKMQHRKNGVGGSKKRKI